MAENSKIEWTDHTFNPWEGCQKVGPGCDHCYAETRNARFGGGVAINWGPGAPRRRTSEANWKKPLRWNKEKFWQCECGWRGADHQLDRAAESASNLTADIPACPVCNLIDLKPTRARVFCASFADVFDNEVSAQWRFDLIKLIEQTPNLDWLLLTKRIGNAAEMLEQAVRAINHGRWGWEDNVFQNVWIGATVVNQEEADRDIPKLLRTPAAKRFLSMEPLLRPVDLRFTNGLVHGCDAADYLVDLVIIGGESGPEARPMHPDWIRSLRDQCAAAGVPFLFKQWGEWAPGSKGFNGGIAIDLQGRVADDGYNLVSYPADAASSDGWTMMHHAGKKAAGRLLDGVQHDGYPEVAA
jgi:protein gp37